MKFKNNFFVFLITLLLFSNINFAFAEQHKNCDYVGSYISDYDFSTVNITRKEKKYILNLFFYRVAIFENVKGIYKNNKIHFDFKDKKYNQFINGSFYKKGNNYILKVNKSNWEDLNIIKEYNFKKENL